MGTKKKNRICTTLIFLFLTVASLLVIYPLYIMFIDSCKTGTELAANSYGLPEKFLWDNYIKLLTYNSGTITRSYINSIFVSTTYTVLVLLVSSLASFGFAKYKFRGKNIIFAALLITMMVPGEINMPAIYLMFAKFQLTNSYSIQILPGIASVFVMFMIRQYMETIPDALVESANIDGASTFRIFWQIMVPLSRPAIGAMAIMTFLGKFNDYLWPKTLLTDEKKMPIMVMLPRLGQNEAVNIIPWETTLAGCTVVALPVIIVFLIFQDQFMSGFVAGAVKE